MSEGTILPPGHYGYDDVAPGDRIETGSAEITAELIDGFADLSGDRFAIHMSTQVAQDYGFADRVAHGLLVLSVIDGLKNAAPAQFRAVASLGWNWRFTAPVLAGDTVRATIEVKAKRPTRQPDRGILTLDFEVRNQRDELVQAGENQLMVFR